MKMKTKAFYESKTFWGCVLGVAGILGAVLRGEMEVSQAITPIMAFVTAFGIRDAI